MSHVRAAPRCALPPSRSGDQQAGPARRVRRAARAAERLEVRGARRGAGGAACRLSSAAALQWPGRPSRHPGTPGASAGPLHAVRRVRCVHRRVGPARRSNKGRRGTVGERSANRHLQAQMRPHRRTTKCGTVRLRHTHFACDRTIDAAVALQAARAGQALAVARRGASPPGVDLARLWKWPRVEEAHPCTVDGVLLDRARIHDFDSIDNTQNVRVARAPHLRRRSVCPCVSQRTSSVCARFR